MSIRVVRNEQGNCVNFVGSTQPAYWNACLTAEPAEQSATQINIRNDNRSIDLAEPIYEFFRIEFTEFQDADGNDFVDRQAAIDYINGAARVTGLGSDEVGTDLTGQSVCFSLDDTSTSVLLDIGYSYGVNTIKAVPNADGTIHILTKLGDRTLFSGLETGLACKADGSVIPGGLNDVANYLNELFTVGPFEAVVISDPFSTMIADVAGVDAGYTLEGTDAVDPAGTDVFANNTSGYRAGLKSTATIDQAGEYFTFDIRNEGQIGFGLVHSDASYAAGHYSGNATYADPAQFAVGNSAHYGYQFSHWFHPTPNGSWTNYGANTAYSQRPGWYNWDQKQDWLDGNPVKIRVGLDVNGYISIESLQDDGSWIVHARTTYPAPEGAEYHLGIKTSNATPRVYSAPKVHLLEPAAPTMNFRWIESPDGVYEWPLFSTAEEANYYDEIITGGSGESHTHTYTDDPTGTSWYMPGNIANHGDFVHTAAPIGGDFSGNPIVWTEITSLSNADLTPPVFTYSDITQQEGSAINIQTQPQDTGYTTTITGLPAGLTSFAGMIQGTLPEVTSDTTYTVTVTRTNSYGSSQGTFDITVTDVAPPQTNDTPWTKALDFSGSAERAMSVSSSPTNTPLKMGGTSNTVAAPTAGQTVTSGYPWATAVVFSPDGHSSNQHIWNLGEGSGTNDDNIYLRVDASRRLYFGWGRSGAINECLIHPDGTDSGWRMTAGNWYGIYVGFNGTRLNGANATAANLAACFDIRLMGSSAGWASVGYSDTNLSNAAAWGSTGGRMNREFNGYMTIGGRGANRNFHGKIASFVSTTLSQGVAMPGSVEINTLITDPIKWVNDYRVGQTYRTAGSTNQTATFALGNTFSGWATQVWLMGDGPSDSYSNMIRNHVQPNDQNYTKLNLISMVSNDIQNVTISGLT